MFSAFMSIKSVMRGIVEFRLSSLLLSYMLSLLHLRSHVHFKGILLLITQGTIIDMLMICVHVIMLISLILNRICRPGSVIGPQQNFLEE